MRARMTALVLVSLLLVAAATHPVADATPPAPTWTARWISVPDAPPSDYGAYHFRRSFELAVRPDTFVVHVTADNRYQLFVNGERVVWAPPGATSTTGGTRPWISRGT